MFYHIYNNKQGFTLIEVLIGVLIVGLLAGLAAPRLKGAWDNAKESACQANMKQIEAALELYYLENNNYPEELSAADTDEKKLNLKAIPTCPHSGENYEYEQEEGKGYKLKCNHHGFFITDAEIDLIRKENKK